MGIDMIKCVVYNSTHEPITIINSKRALILVLEGKAVVVEEHPTLRVRSPSQSFGVPTIIALKVYVRGRNVYKTPAALTQRNLFIRDNRTCQYCLRSEKEFKSKEFLTRDHVIPESMGGKSTWTNLITCCSTCNNKKGNTPLHNTTMTLAKPPTQPSLFEIWMKSNKLKLKK